MVRVSCGMGKMDGPSALIAGGLVLGASRPRLNVVPRHAFLVVVPRHALVSFVGSFWRTQSLSGLFLRTLANPDAQTLKHALTTNGLPARADVNRGT